MSHEWTPADTEQLATAYAAGGARGARAAFPHRSEGSVLSAVRRYVLAPVGDPTPIDSESVRRRLREISIERLADLLPPLMHRRTDYIGAQP